MRQQQQGSLLQACASAEMQQPGRVTRWDAEGQEVYQEKKQQHAEETGGLGTADGRAMVGESVVSPL